MSAFADQGVSDSASACHWLASTVTREQDTLDDIGRITALPEKTLSMDELHAIGTTYRAIFDNLSVQVSQLARFECLVSISKEIPELSRYWTADDSRRAANIMMAKCAISHQEVITRAVNLLKASENAAKFEIGLKNYLQRVAVNANMTTKFAQDTDTISEAKLIERGVKTKSYLIERLELRIKMLKLLSREMEFLAKLSESESMLNNSAAQLQLYDFWRTFYFFNRPEQLVETGDRDDLYQAFLNKGSFLKSLISDAFSSSISSSWNQRRPDRLIHPVFIGGDSDSGPQADLSDLGSPAADITH